MTQTGTKLWSTNIKVQIKDINQSEIAAKVTLLAGSKEYQAHYNPNNNEFVFDSLPTFQGEIKITADGYESQTNKFQPQTNAVRTYYLGKPGSAYMVKDDYLVPYKKYPGVYGMYLSGISRDSIETILKPFLNKMGYEYQGSYYNNRLVQVKARKQINPQLAIQELIKHPNISDAGEVFGQQEITGFFSSEFSVTFDGLGTEEMTQLIEKYNCIVISSRGVTFRVRLKEGGKETITNIARKMINEPGVRLIHHRIIPYNVQPTD